MPDHPVVLVTGGSRGIGAATCRLLASRGYDLAVNCRSDRAAGDRVAAECRALGAQAAVVVGDVSIEEQITAVFDRAVEALGPLSHVINNAGITGRSSPLADAPGDVIRTCIDVNVTGAILVAREAARRLSTGRGGEGGSIVNISSVAATLGSPGEYVWYAASKGAIDALTVGLAQELATEGVRVNAVSPGLVDTEIHALSTEDAGRVARIGPLIPLGRPGLAAEIAEAVAFLVSAGASYVTGANIRVSGGR